MLHLPALVITKQIEKVFRSLQKISLAVRGLYGEGSQAMGDFYQISNQITLGRTEIELVQASGRRGAGADRLRARAREFLVRESQETLHDQVSRAYGILRTAQNNQLRRNDAPAVPRADGGEPRADSRFGDTGSQRAIHPHSAGPSAKDPRRRTRHRRPQHRTGPLSAPHLNEEDGNGGKN